MFVFDKHAVPVARALKKILDDIRYDVIQRTIRGGQYFVDPWPHFGVFEESLETLPDDERTCLELFLLGKPVSREKTENIIGHGLINDLIGSEMLRERDGLIRTNNLSVVSYLDRYFVTGLPYFYPTCVNKDTAIYMGGDSYWLAQNIMARQQDSILDLCTGTGIQAILSSAAASKATGVELNVEAYNMAKFNVALNGLNHKVEILQGHLYGAVSGKKYDLIYSNPPFLPVPYGIQYPLCGNGGMDGLKIIWQIVDGLDVHLNPEGQAVIIGETIGDRTTPFFIEKLKRLHEEKGWDTFVAIRDSMPLFLQSHMIAHLTSQIYSTDKQDELTERWKNLYKNMNAEYLYPFILIIKKIANGKFKVVKPFEAWYAYDRPITRSGISFEEAVSSYVVKGKNGQVLGEIDRETYEFLSLCDGQHRVEEIVSKIYPGYSSKYGKLGIDKALNDALTVCDTLEQMGAIKARNGSHANR